jgi:hypothetical protein
MFTIGSTNGPIMAELPLLDPLQLPVVGKCPKSSPQFSHKRMGIDQADPTVVGPSDMADNDLTFDGIALYKSSHL